MDNLLNNELSLLVALKYGQITFTDQFVDSLPPKLVTKINQSVFPSAAGGTSYITLKFCFQCIECDYSPTVQETFRNRIQEVINLYELDEQALVTLS